MTHTAALPGLPGSGDDPGEGPAEVAALDGLLDDGAGVTAMPADALAAHRAVAGGDHRDLLATLVLAAGGAEELPPLLTGADLGLRILLAADPADPLQTRVDALLAARAALLDTDHAEVVGWRLPLPEVSGSADPGRLVDALLDTLDATVPTWITIPAGTSPAVLDVLAADGAEHVTIDLAGTDPRGLARLVRDLVDRDLTFRAAGADGLITAAGGVPGALNVLCAVRAALNGAEPMELESILLATHAPVLASAVRRMSAADAAVARAFLAAVEVRDAAAAVAGLAALQLLPAGGP